MIKKDTVLGLITEGMEFKTKKEAKEVAEAKIKEFNDLVDKVGSVLEEGEKARLGDIEIAKVRIPARDGETRGVKWHKDEEVVVKVKKVK
jgi:hypothetical protein